MAITVRNLEPVASSAAAPGSVGGKDARSKLPAILITTDDALWPQIGKFIPGRFALRQTDSVEQLLGDTEAGAAAVLIWDVREEGDVIARLSALQQHSPRLAVLVLDEAGKSAEWQTLIRQNQIVAMVGSPIAEGEFVKLLNQAGEEVQARSALLGKTTATPTPPAPPAARPRLAWMAAAALALLAAIGAFALLRGDKSPQPVPVVTSLPEPVVAPRNGQGEQIEALLESAGQAMVERRYVTPADNNALYFYRRVLNFDAANGEARQGLDRVAELLLVRAQGAVDQRQFEQALQALEVARSLKPGDPRVQALDQRLSGMRAELGPSQIQAALGAQNFERAAALIDEATRARTLSASQAGQLRESVKAQRAEFEISRLTRLAQTRLQQDRLVEPANDSASFYLERARRAGAAAAQVATETRQLQQKLADGTRAAIEQHRLDEADKLLAALRAEGAGAGALASLQDGLAAARAKDLRSKAEESTSAAVRDAGESERKAAAATAPTEVALKLLSPLRPEYPREAAMRDIEGWVDLSFTVTAAGTPVDVRVVKAAPPGVFDKAALKALQQARYQALSSTDMSVTRQVNLRVKFQLAK